MGDESLESVVQPRLRFRYHWALNEIDENRENRREYSAIIRDGIKSMEEDMEVLRRVLELRIEGRGTLEIQRILASGPKWMRRTKRQIEYMVRPTRHKFRQDQEQGTSQWQE